MRHYHIYLIEDDVAETFFGEESKLFHLFMETVSSESVFHRNTLQKQIDYITKPIPVFAIEKELRNAFRHRRDYSQHAGWHLIEIPGTGSRAQLKIGESRMEMESTGCVAAETTFFEVLRQSERCLLAVEFNEHRCGWLKPVKQTNII
ncbi:MAG TPA: sporulation inhibitor of replication protein SirA [Bacillales bacterium]|nr:sporulation inhibitor of replication protein SirA [Bacillales bacterium]